MHPRVIRAIARKDALDLLLNKQTLVMLLTPILLALFFLGLTWLIGGKSTTEILVYNPDHVPGKIGVEQVFTGAIADARLTYARSAEEVTAAFGPDGARKPSGYALGLIVPANFEASVQAGQQPELKL